MKTIREPFQQQVSSDVVRNRISVELLSGDQVVAEVFRCDTDRSLIITTFSNDLPLVVIEELIAVAREELQAFDDGTPLPVYVSKEQ
ncbi:MAG: hypothetical protein VXW65_09585 [Pseudomonadota bacterium]|nr:hypothetical protein [Pseudomonadota bacterium]